MNESLDAPPGNANVRADVPMIDVLNATRRFNYYKFALMTAFYLTPILIAAFAIILDQIFPAYFKIPLCGFLIVYLEQFDVLPIFVLFTLTSRPNLLFNTRAAWYILEAFGPFGGYLRQQLSYSDTLHFTLLREVRITLYFLPILLINLPSLIWRFSFVLGSACIAMLLLAFGTRRMPARIRIRIGWRELFQTIPRYWHNNMLSLTAIPIWLHWHFLRPYLQREVAATIRNDQNIDWESIPEFLYRPLQGRRNIRLLKIAPRLSRSSPVCTLTEVSLDYKPEYEAMSYCWGPKAQEMVHILVDKRRILVTKAVRDIIFYRSSYLRSRSLWIDALCINQSDLEEKSSQIPLMADIYRKAAEVVIWLGPPSNNLHSVRLLEVLTSIKAQTGSDMSRQMELLQDLRWNQAGSQEMRAARAVDAVERHFINPALANASSSAISTRVATVLGVREQAALRALAELFRNEWFERMWIIQEIVFAKNIHIEYKGAFFDWTTFTQLIETHSQNLAGMARLVGTPAFRTPDRLRGRVRISLEATNVTNLAVLNKWRKAYQAGKPPTFGTVLGETRRFLSTDLRDRIFAILGFIRTTRSEFVPCYSDPLDKAYTDFTQFALQQDDWFLMFWSHKLRVRSPDPDFDPEQMADWSSLERLPSWVPDYTTPSDVLFTLPFRHPPDPAHRRPPQHIRFSDNGLELTVKAVLLDTIVDVGPGRADNMETSEGRNPFYAQLDTIAEWYFQSQELVRRNLISTEQDAGDVDQMLWELLVRTNRQIPSPVRLPHEITSQEMRGLVEDRFRYEIDLFRQDREPDLIHEIDSVLEAKKRMVYVSFGKAVGITLGRSVALLPSSAQPKTDVIAFIKGTYYPVILRRVDSEKDAFTFVGACFGGRDVPKDSEVAWRDITIQ
ncbi:heterokaryon incompatibility protein-domain-containing protein [Hyaloscypha sp. PMI_1271]|nr:heterokaryon incompatibility protein-domain-containing protein [Hyaloscypha sp. PMI_1271]